MCFVFSSFVAPVIGPNVPAAEVLQASSRPDDHVGRGNGAENLLNHRGCSTERCLSLDFLIFSSSLNTHTHTHFISL